MTHAAQFVLTHGALVLFLWILIQQIGLPIPSAPLLISVGSLASSGRIGFATSLMAAFGADLVVMGAYGHSYLSEWMFGSVTRTIVREASLPVLMSR